MMERRGQILLTIMFYLVYYFQILNPTPFIVTDAIMSPDGSTFGASDHMIIAHAALFMFAVGVNLRDLGIARRYWSENVGKQGVWDVLQKQVAEYESLGVYDKIDEKYKQLFRMNRMHFNLLLDQIGDGLEPLHDIGARGIPKDKRLGIILNCLAHGESQSSLLRRNKMTTILLKRNRP